MVPSIDLLNDNLADLLYSYELIDLLTPINEILSEYYLLLEPGDKFLIEDGTGFIVLE